MTTEMSKETFHLGLHIPEMSQENGVPRLVRAGSSRRNTLTHPTYKGLLGLTVFRSVLIKLTNQIE